MPAALDAEIDRPLYLQIVDALRREIAGKRPGERIDSEPALAERLRARAAGGPEQRLLELGDATVVMEVARSTYDRAGSLIDFVEAVYDARRYAYQAEIRSADAKEDANGWKTSAPNAFGPRFGPRGDGRGGGG